MVMACSKEVAKKRIIWFQGPKGSLRGSKIGIAVTWFLRFLKGVLRFPVYHIIEAMKPSKLGTISIQD